MVKKIVLMLAAVILLTAAGFPARAEGETGEILVWLRDGEQIVTGGSLEIYRAGDPVPEGWLLGPEFGGGIVAGEDVLSGEFARWMAEKAGPGFLALPDGNGMVWFEGLEPGIYLIRQTQCPKGYQPVEPYLACITEELLRVDTYPKLRPETKTPKTAQNGDIYFAALGLSGALSGLAFFSERKKSRKRA